MKVELAATGLFMPGGAWGRNLVILYSRVQTVHVGSLQSTLFIELPM
jgi:hypothetical protein